MDSKKIIEKLVKIAHNQQKIIHKLAQALPPDSVPTSGTTYTPGVSPSPAPAPTPGNAVPGTAPTHTEAKAIINSLPADVKSQLVNLEVHNGQVMVKWKVPVPAATFNAVQKTVQNLQQQNVLPGSSYKVVEKA
jgi:hypothetical protein